MKRTTVNTSAFVVALVFIATVAAVAEDLDAALEAQKKKAARRVYSERAVLTDHSLTVPRPESEEDRLLDKKLREIDAKADARPALLPAVQAPRPAMAAQHPQEDNNWLTAAVLDASADVSLQNNEENEWMARELDRHKRLMEQPPLNQDNAQIEKDLHNRITSQPGLPEMNSLKKYQLDPAGSLNSGDETDPGYITPQSVRINPLATGIMTPKQDAPAAPALFSPEAARLSSSEQNQPASPQSSLISPTSRLPEQKSSSVFSYDRRKSDPTPLTPLEQIRKTSPINRPNPFAEDHMPTVKTSIWD